MRNIIKNTMLLGSLFLMLTFSFIACTEGDGDKDYGLSYIYMPQATSTGGLNNNYLVPLGGGEYTYNFKVSEDKTQLQVILGVLRSGSMTGFAYTVDIVSQADLATQVVESGEIKDAMVLPQSFYSLPQSISVTGNNNGGTFYMSVSMDALKQEALVGKKLVMAVAISNPTAYELSPVNTNTVVVIDVDAILNIINNLGQN
ncbi:hypothetical protein JGH11_18815 [Dysgonomonas sp. Marseille-P4677]|uniref:hypothetical protein n=1 Tax=Dysgonomonas sp. Marseille-P4677 TaxID=2364790 RepID=UPI0019133DAF|nr:hypothetical protein [Dysgonomonas sp. Marseille-P4677]MBK5722925.1 hypothetical protein [Dysgonomonas sp. Marseille-P4677]